MVSTNDIEYLTENAGSIGINDPGLARDFFHGGLVGSYLNPCPPQFRSKTLTQMVAVWSSPEIIRVLDILLPQMIERGILQKYHRRPDVLRYLVFAYAANCIRQGGIENPLT